MKTDVNYKITGRTAADVYELLKDCEKLLSERISAMRDVPELIQARHAYIYYRSFVIEAIFKLRDNLTEIKK